MNQQNPDRQNQGGQQNQDGQQGGQQGGHAPYEDEGWRVFPEREPAKKKTESFDGGRKSPGETTGAFTQHPPAHLRRNGGTMEEQKKNKRRAAAYKSLAQSEEWLQGEEQRSEKRPT